ncbi:MAG: hypothetical protein P8177_04060 [Gemmatimonadota bacterium]|jgi:hypothetical protein
MADVNPEVMDMITKELKKNPDTSNPELLAKAKKIDESVGDLTARQFNARYPLQVKRAMKPRKAAPRKAPRKPKRTRSAGNAAASGDRDRIRGVLLELARDVANAQGKGDVVDVIAGIDGYVDRVAKARG